MAKLRFWSSRGEQILDRFGDGVDEVARSAARLSSVPATGIPTKNQAKYNTVKPCPTVVQGSAT